uniref:Uncharacterized protein n=1 Tax=Moniliophthora roreri TaxID=221103 RepID=A0A0W0GFS9_MONRR
MWLTKLAITGKAKVKLTIVKKASVTNVESTAISGECPTKLKEQTKKEPNGKQTPKDAYYQICAIYWDYSAEEQTQILDLMEEEGFWCGG